MLYLTITVNVDIITLNENLFLKLFFLEKEGFPNAIVSAEMNFINTVRLIQAARL